MRHEEYRKNPLAVGTAHFRDTVSAVTYYRAYGCTREDVLAKITRKEIAIGAPLKADGTRYEKCWTDADGRYWIEG
jgi:hypothetical protein